MRWRISLRYLLTHLRQTLVCVAGVAISVLMFIVMDAMMSGFRDKFIIETVESSGHITIRDEPREQDTPILEQAYPQAHGLLVLERSKPREQVKEIKNAQGLLRKVRALPYVEAAVPQVNGGAIATYGTKTINVDILGAEPVPLMQVTTIGEDVTEGDFGRLRSTADGIVVGRGIALVLGAKVGDTINLSATNADGTPGGKASARIVGIFATGVVPVDYSRAYMMLANAQTLLDKKNIVNQIVIRSVDYTQARAFASQIEVVAGYKTESWQETNENFLKIFVVQDVMTIVITGAILIVAAFGVLNILIMAVLERINDIAIMKSFGFSRADITQIFIMQGLVIGVIGSASGLVIAHFAIAGLRRIPIKVEGLIRSEGLLMTENASQYITAFVAAMIVVTIAAVYPARRAAKFDPVEVIRGAH